MKRYSAPAFAFMLSVSVSGLALAMDSSTSGNPSLTVPPSSIPAPKTRYVPSVPARDNAVVSEPKTATPKQRYVPSVPARIPEQDPAVEAAAPAPAKLPAKAKAEKTPAKAPTVRYVPSVPERKTEQAPATAAATAAATDETAAPQTRYVPSAPVHPMEKKKAETPAAPVRAPADSGLSAALAKAYNTNPELSSFRSRAKAADEQIPQAYAGWLPTARADYSYGYNKEKLNNRALNGTHPESKSVTVTQPIFNGGETVARTSRAFNAVTLARAQLTDAEQRILSDGVRAYMDVVRTDEIAKLSRNNEQVLREQLQATRDRFKLGETTRTDVAQSESRLARATSDKVRAEGDFDVAKANYLRVIGEAVPSGTSLKMPTQLPPIPKSLEEALSIGLVKNPALIAADANRNIADDDIDIATSTLLPDVSLRGSKSDETGLSSSRGGARTESTFTVNASIPIFQSGAEYSRVRQGKRTRQQRKEEYEDTRNVTVENITSRWRDIVTARASIVSNKAAVESATVALNGVRQEADVGTRTTLDVLDAEQELFLARVNLVTAQSREVIAVYSLLSAAGILTASDLALNVEPYDPTIHERSVKYRIIGF